jgi:hypothetical protein
MVLESDEGTVGPPQEVTRERPRDTGFVVRTKGRIGHHVDVPLSTVHHARVLNAPRLPLIARLQRHSKTPHAGTVKDDVANATVVAPRHQSRKKVIAAVRPEYAPRIQNSLHLVWIGRVRLKDNPQPPYTEHRRHWPIPPSSAIAAQKTSPAL